MSRFARREPVALLHPETGLHVTPTQGLAYDDNDPLVRAFPWAFLSAQEAAAELGPEQFPESVPIESATRAPGEKRSTRRAQ